MPNLRRRLSSGWWVLLIAVAAVAAPRAQQPPTAPDPSPFRELTFRNIGPAITGGRIVEFAVVEETPAVIYAATASGGAFKTSNGGTTWTPVFDREDTVSIGAIALSQQRKLT